MRIATTIALASFLLSIAATKAWAVPVDVSYFLDGRFYGVPGTPDPGYAGGDLEVIWDGAPDGAITGSTGEVKSFYIAENIRQFFGDYFFTGYFDLAAQPGMAASIDLPNRRMTLSGPAALSGELTCSLGFDSCDVFGLPDGVPTPIDEELIVDFVFSLAYSDPLSPNLLSMGRTPLGVRVGTLDIDLSISGSEFERTVPEPSTGLLFVAALTLWAASRVRPESRSHRVAWSTASGPARANPFRPARRR